MAAHSGRPQATSRIDEGTYRNATVGILACETIASHGSPDERYPPTTHRSLVVHARDDGLSGDAMLFHDIAKVDVRAMRHPFDVRTSAVQ